MILLGSECRLQTCRGLAAQRFNSALRMLYLRYPTPGPTHVVSPIPYRYSPGQTMFVRSSSTAQVFRPFHLPSAPVDTTTSLLEILLTNTYQLDSSSTCTTQVYASSPTKLRKDPWMSSANVGYSCNPDGWDGHKRPVLLVSSVDRVDLKKFPLSDPAGSRYRNTTVGIVGLARPAVILALGNRWSTAAREIATQQHQKGGRANDK